MSQPLLLTIWDQYIFYKNPAIHIFTILSHLLSNKARILAYPQSELLELMTHLPFENDESTYVFEEQVDPTSSDLGLDKVCIALNEELRNRTTNPTILTDLVIVGLKLMHRTPPGFIHRLNDLLNDKISVSIETLHAYSQAPCVMTTPVEIYTFLLRGVERNVNCLRYLILDTRSTSAFHSAHLVSSKNISLHTLENMGKMEGLVRKIRSHEYHVVVLEGEKTGRESVCGEVVNYLVKKQCKFVSEVMGGFDRIMRLIEAEGNRGEELVVREMEHKKEDPNRKEQKDAVEEKSASHEVEKKQEMIKVVNGKQCLLYESWLSNPQVKDFVCMKVQKVQKEGKEVFVYTSEKRMVLTK